MQALCLFFYIYRNCIFVLTYLCIYIYDFCKILFFNICHRELREECGLTGELRKLGALYVDGRKEDTIFVVHVFDTYSDSETFEKSEGTTFKKKKILCINTYDCFLYFV